jgi:hypothetical protein
MKIEALEAIKSGDYILTAGDSITVPDEIGAHWCKHGWAKDVAGVFATGERRVINAVVNATTSNHLNTSDAINAGVN